PDGALALSGQISSGDGQLKLDGGSREGGSLEITATGTNFLAANIPGARVVVSPDLKARKLPTRLNLDGTVTVASADIDLSKLPRASSAEKASPDVVVVDDPQTEKAASMPVYASITFKLPDADTVKLVGFGLTATLHGELRVDESPGAKPVGSGD